MYCSQFALSISIALLFSISLGEDFKNSSVETTQTQTETTGSKASSVPVSYKAPRSVCYPYGDESMVNNNMLNKSATPEANCADEHEFIEYKPECTGPVEGTDELYVACMKSELTVEPIDSICSSSKSADTSPVHLPSLICKRCDLQQNTENTAVRIHCVHCYNQADISNRNRLDFNCIANYIEISNYTSPPRIFKEF